MNSKSITIVAPAYNHEKYIEKCLYSIANQPCEEMELIIIDDLSKDSTADIIEKTVCNEEFKQRFKLGVTFIRHTENKGAFYSINEGIEAANGHYVTVINTDDYYGRNRLNKMLDLMIKENANMSFGGVKVIDQFDRDVTTGYGHELMKYQKLIPKCPLVSMALTRGNGTISTGNMVFSKELYEKLEGFGNYKYVHDWDFALRASLVSEPLFIPEALYYYRVHTGNTIAEIRKNKTNPDMLEKPENGKTIGINPLVKHFISIKKGDYENYKIPSEDVWNYFINHKKYYYDDDGIVWAWNEAEKMLED